MELTSNIVKFDSLKKRGWYETSVSDNKELIGQLISLGKELGNLVRNRRSADIVQKLVPVDSVNSHPNSLSSIYSCGEFPLHVDTAHWLVPCRYMILGCYNKGKSERKTTLLDYRDLDISDSERILMLNAPFKIASGRVSFYGQVLSKTRNFIRFDPGCMTPATKQGEELLEIFSERRVNPSLREITWEENKIVIIDNWRMLHGRGRPMNKGSDRVLYRVLVA